MSAKVIIVVHEWVNGSQLQARHCDGLNEAMKIITGGGEWDLSIIDNEATASMTLSGKDGMIEMQGYWMDHKREGQKE